ncbi:hypothetical protein C7271_11820 [filamentous cyanobacterium CCP5]|nr:hypothetical protein C7271_11820 [filamentous cyanobacterium CCP5]
MSTSPSPLQAVWQVADLEGLPDSGNRYEIISGELQVTRAPHWRHQKIADKICAALNAWSTESSLGEAVTAPGIVFSEWDAVIPDVVWASDDHLAETLDEESGHLMGPPELIVEILSRTPKDRQRDQTTKLKLYSVQGVREYWIVDPKLKSIEVYRHSQGQLQKAMTLYPEDTAITPLIPGFAADVATFFE